MKIRNKLYLSTGIIIILVIILVSVIFITSYEITRKNKTRELLRNVNLSASELNIITYEYLLHHEKRMEKQWYLKYYSLAKSLEKITTIAAKRDEEELIKLLHADYAALSDLFSRVTTNYKKIQKHIQEETSQERIDAVILLEERLVAQLSIKSQSIISNATRLGAKAYAETMAARELANNLTFILIMILVVVAVTTSLLVARSISKPLDELTIGVEIIGKGNLKHRIDVESKDEIGNLTTAFNQMTENLKKVTASRDDLNREITERKQAQERLLEAKVELEEKVHELNRSHKAMLYMVEDLNKTSKELKAAQEELISKERLAVLGQFSGSISHELRNPLGVIDSSIYYLKAKLKNKDKKVYQHLERIKSSVHRATTIIQSLLNLTRMKKPQKSRDDLVPVVLDAIVSSKIPDRVKVIKNFPIGEIPVNVEREQIRMALKNMIRNAVEAMEENGTLTIKIQKNKEGKAEVACSDTGCGIVPENLEKIFRPLFTTKAKGIGFGLSITQMIIENHDGSVKVESKPGKGAKFIINLPCI